MAAKLQELSFVFAFLFWAELLTASLAVTDPLDATALSGVYLSLNQPRQLTRWKLIGGDPCGESWKGIECAGTSIKSIKISGLGISGMMGIELASLRSLKELDISHNNIHGEIPYFLPPSATHINLAFNQLTQNIPPALASLRSLSYLNLSHNALSGSIGDIFTGLKNLKQMDLSNNIFTGDLPVSFVTLTKLTALDLQNNEFTGSVNFLAALPLSYLNIRNNHFSGVIPKQFELIPNLSIEGNIFATDTVCPPPNTTPGNGPSSQNSTNSQSIENDSHEQKRLGHSSITGPAALGSIFMVVAFFISAAVVIHIHIRCKCQLDWLENFFRSLLSLPNSLSDSEPTDSPEKLSLGTPSLASPRPLCTIHQVRLRSETFHGRSYTKRSKTPMTAVLYNMAQLLGATENFSKNNILGEGNMGPIYKGKFPDGQILAVNVLEMGPMSLHEEDLFLDVISSVSRLRHPNIASLLGYCLEHGQHILVYNYIGNVSLVDSLHCAQRIGKALTWNSRLRISLAVARALEYLHLTCDPPVTHGHVTATNIFLDHELVPRLCNCGLADIRPLIRSKLKSSPGQQAYEMPTDSMGFTAPSECGPPDKTKCDTHSFGILLMELLTGKKPHESSRTGELQFLVKWASICPCDIDSLNGMVDPAIKGQYTCKILSQFADAISFCIQPQPECRPPMSAISEMLMAMIHQMESSRNV